MRLLFVADGRSPIALNWIAHFVRRGDEVHLASTFPCRPDLELASLSIVPVAFSEAAGLVWQPGGGNQGGRPGLAGRAKALMRRTTPGLRTLLRQWAGPLTVSRSARRLRTVIDRVRPDLVHAMRIPFEGMVAARAVPAGVPLLVSVWGNDFTLHAPANRRIGALTRLTLQRAGALHADCCRDVRLARDWGFSADKPAVVLPGGGGVQPELFYPPEEGAPQAPVVINPRALRPYIRSDTFFKAVPIVASRLPGVRFVCPAMAGLAQALGWMEALGISEEVVALLPPVSRPQMGELFRQAQVVVSPSTHDGTPNTLLEALACGCFPVAGDLESLREWITPGVNGLLVDPADPQMLAEALIQALEDAELRRKARDYNLSLIARRADYETVMERAGQFYTSLTGG